MKLPLHFVVPMMVIIPTDGYTCHHQGSSTFAGRGMVTVSYSRRQAMPFSRQRKSMTMYEPSNDPPNDGDIKNMWSALASTERWISDTLSSNARAGSGGRVENPYTRKELSYVCETSDEGAMIVAGIFRRLREARELGETHGSMQEEQMLEQEDFSPRTMRQTQVVVVSSSKELAESFQTFDNLVQVINQARRNARDYVTDVALEKLDEKLHGDEEERDWVVSINCAHLHPKFGEKTPQQVLEEMKEEEEEGEVDVNLKAYKERREAARRSPYPTVVIEVMATPPPDYGAHPPKQQANKNDSDKVTAEDVQKLEALFGKSAAMHHPAVSEDDDDDDDDDAFYAAIGRTTGIDEISLVTPIILAQNWISQHDQAFDAATSAFTVSDVMHVDAGYEFVFTNLAMQASKFLKPEQEPTASKSGVRQYLVMNNFLSSSATSFEKFALQVENIIGALELTNKVQVQTFHPEHIDPAKRSPVPIFALEWSTL